MSAHHTLFTSHGSVCTDLISYLKKELTQQEKEGTHQQILYYTNPLHAHGCVGEVREMVRTSFFLSPLKIKVDDSRTGRINVYNPRASITSPIDTEIKLIVR